MLRHSSKVIVEEIKATGGNSNLHREAQYETGL
jgi:hypothetical protein